MKIKKFKIDCPIAGKSPDLPKKSRAGSLFRNLPRRNGLSLIEMLVAVGIVAFLVSVVISVAGRLDTQDKINSTKGTIAILNTALNQFQDYGFTYSHANYENLKFPIDCNDFQRSEIETALRDAIGKQMLNLNRTPDVNEFSGIEAMYFLLSRVPECKETLGKLNPDFVILDGTISFTGDVEESCGLIHINDAWRRPLRYDYYEDENTPGSAQMRRSIKTFPIISSAGPDGEFDTSDDIKSR